ncbi:hypothetical protein [uncultured Deinococcus sp.]|uniref:hypothetical protein n=1 Tax=uncultured Deinococcus sp. TaxID=158789 RepID=UPI0025F76B99|nr:hypothetical protein [uncultured Deinococcus sp.]
MPRQKMPAAAEMAYLVRTSSRRFGREQSLPDPLPERGPAFEQLKAHYQGWAAVQWVEEHGEQVADITAFHDGTRVRAGNSLDKRLWRERILYVTPLQGYYRLPSRLWQWVLRAGVAAGHFPAVVAPEAVTAPAEPAAHPYLITLANKPSVLIDRATRGPDGWNDATLQYREVFEEGLILNYYEENAGKDALRQQLMTLDPRTSDVWRLLTAKALEHDHDDLFTPITIKPGELARALGLKAHPNGSVRPKDLLRCTQSLFHLERLWLTLPDAGPDDDEGTRQRVLAVMARGRSRKIDGQSVPSSWTIVLGDWAKYFPRSFAPIFRGLVELPANSATNLWAKQIGTELSYWLRETANDATTIRFIPVKTLLLRASLMQDVLDLREHKNQNRAIERFEATLELLGTLGLHERWSYEARSSAAMDAVVGKPEFFETWLASLVELQVPEPFLRSIAELAKAEQEPGRAANRHLTAVRRM